MRVFPLSNWTELDVWQYILREGIEIVPLYFAAERPTVERDGLILMVDDERMRLEPASEPVDAERCGSGRSAATRCRARSRARRRRSRTSSRRCWLTTTSERQGRAIDRDAGSGSWRRRSRRAIFDGPPLDPTDLIRTTSRWLASRSEGAAAVHHLRQRRRRQVDADRAAALRNQAGLRRPARRAGERQQAPRHAGRGDRFRAAGRRAVGRARAGHHDRRRLPLFREREAQVHRRRHAGARAIYAQHGHRRVDRRPRGAAGRCAQGRADADAAAFLSRARWSASGASCWR